MEQLNQLFIQLHNGNAVPILAILGGLLILADYYFDTDVPAHLGYVCFALAAFLMGPLSAYVSLLIGLLVWSLLLNLHFIFLRALLVRDVTGPSSEWKRTGK